MSAVVQGGLLKRCSSASRRSGWRDRAGVVDAGLRAWGLATEGWMMYAVIVVANLFGTAVAARCRA
jgi:hypothetical protein